MRPRAWHLSLPGSVEGSGGRCVCVKTVGRTLGVVATPAIPAAWQAEAGEFHVPGQPQQLSKMLSPNKPLKRAGVCSVIKRPRFKPQDPNQPLGRPLCQLPPTGGGRWSSGLNTQPSPAPRPASLSPQRVLVDRT